MDLQAIIRRAIEIGDQHGFITFDQLNEFMPSSPSLSPRILKFSLKP
jgi:hypothetical protein